MSQPIPDHLSPGFTAPPELHPGLAQFGRRSRAGAFVLWGIGSVLILISSMSGQYHLWSNLLLSGFVLTCVGIGGLFLIAVQVITGARWSDPLLKVLYALPRTLPFAFLLLLSVAIGARHLYPWAQPEAVADPTLHGRLVWLNPAFFTARVVIYFALWIGLGWVLRRHRRFAGPFIAIFGITFSLASFDWLLSLEPHWSGTIFGLYCFAGMFLMTLALLTISAIVLRRLGLLEDIAKTRNHDLGKLLFAFSCFWAYLWFSQFLLIWYANLPEETGPIRQMLRPDWWPLHALNLLLGFGIPFVFLLSARAKKNERLLLWIAIIVLAGRWHDFGLLVYQPISHGGPPFIGLGEVGSVLITLGLGHLACWPAFVRKAPNH